MTVHTLVLGDLDTNAYVVADVHGNALIIDPADDAEAILSFVRDNGYSVSSVVLTHAHFDHMLAAEKVAETLGVSLFVGRGDAPAMTDPIRNLSGLFGISSEVRISTYKTLVEDDVVRVGDLAFSVLETPGHTPGCICLLCDDILFSGDTLFERSIGRLDFPGGDPAAMLASLQRLMALAPATTVYPGHGRATTIGAEMAYNPYLR